MKEARRNEVIEIWKSIIEVQRHFNDVSMRIRGMFVTILLGFFAALGFLLDQNLSIEIGDLRIKFSTLVPMFGLFATWLLYFIDRYWYHRLLVGSVKHGIAIEQQYKDEIPELSLSAKIGEESPFTPRWPLSWIANLLVSHDKFRQEGRLHSDGKIELFYKSVMLVLFLTMAVLSVGGGITFFDHNATVAPKGPLCPQALQSLCETVSTLEELIGTGKGN
ncbi:hypothetical protein NKH19_00660 [Mesorhizobium sp. M1338]|uniref:hypothetical protein n=1 Tax=unclassified Mesorhizobium TaxID=325217 RepID=UPI00333D8AAC